MCYDDVNRFRVISPCSPTWYRPVSKRIACLNAVPGECTGIVGWPESEALPLLSELAEQIIRPEFQYRHHWRVGDFLMWDNWYHIKRSKDYELPLRRLMYRTTIAGTPTF